MKNIFSSPRHEDKDLQKFSKLTLQDVMNELKVINSNILYVTYKLDKVSAQQRTLDAQEFYDEDKNPGDT